MEARLKLGVITGTIVEHPLDRGAKPRVLFNDFLHMRKKVCLSFVAASAIATASMAMPCLGNPITLAL
jgi:hypothetical protein